MKNEIGLSWNQLLHNARMMQAMVLLVTPDAQVTEVAYEVGYSSLSAFCVAFSNFVGETPRDYKRRSKL